MKFDLKSWIAGYALGRTGIPLPFAVKPGAYLYNGWKLPPLPQWDREAYPHAFILIPDGSVPNSDYAALYLTSVRPVMEGGILTFGSGEVLGTEVALDRENGCALEIQWPELMQSEATGVVMAYVRWADEDLWDAEGNVYLAASMPEAVYEQG